MNNKIVRYALTPDVPFNEFTLNLTWGKVEALAELEKQLGEFFKIPFFVTMSCRNTEEFLKEVNRLQTERLDALEKIYIEFKEKFKDK